MFFEEKEESDFESDLKIKFCRNQEVFTKIPGNVISYWVGDTAIKTFEKQKTGDKFDFSYGVFTCNNEKFLRMCI